MAKQAESLINRAGCERNAKKSAEACRVKGNVGRLVFEVEDEEDVTVLRELHMRMGEIYDPRNQAYMRHELGDVIMIVLLAVLADADEWLEVEAFGIAHEKWLRRFLQLKNGIPSDDTFKNVMSLLNTNYVYGIEVSFLIKKWMK